MKTLKELTKDWESRIESDCKPVDMEQRFRDMLNECYSFKEVGGPFKWMTPSRVLEEMNPTAFRCGVNDYADGESDEIVELSSGYYRIEDCKEVQDEIAAELDTEIEDLRENEADEDSKQADELEMLLSQFRDMEPYEI
jgi:hypothetical protein